MSENESKPRERELDDDAIIGGSYITTESLTQPFIGTVADVKLVMMKSTDGGEREEYVLVFDNGTRCVLNTTNRNILREAFGPTKASWKGHRVEVFRHKTTYAGRKVDGKCVKPAADDNKAAEPAPF
jgi:hypothetical protein